MGHVESQLTKPELAPSFPSGQVMSLHAVLQQRADHERIVVAMRKLREKCFAVTEDGFREIEGRFHHQLWQLKYAGIELSRVRTRGTFEANLQPKVKAQQHSDTGSSGGRN